MLDIAGQDSGLEPREAPGVFDSNDSVGARDYVWEREAAIEVTLIAAEQVTMRVGIGRDKSNHYAGGGFAGFAHQAFDGHHARQREHS